jgi:isopenicillin N synthase-like dioxygenase
MNYATARSVDFSEIPVVDLAPARDGGGEGLARVAAAVRRAAIEVGFFYVTGHGVPPAVVREAYAAARRFFERPLEDKLKVAVNARHRGFIRAGEAKMYAQARPDLKESFIFGLDLPESDPDVRAGKSLMGPNVWPADMPEMKAALDAYYAAVVAAGQPLLRAFAVALELDREFFVTRFAKPLARGSIIWYPPQPPQLGEEQFGVAPHSDYGCLTLLSQDSNGGLQVRNRAGEWIAAPPVEGSFVINIGDLMARWTDDLFVSTPHRVVNASGRARQSIALFYDPHYDTAIETLPSCLAPGAAPRYEPTTCGAYVKGRFDAAFAYRKKG